MIDAYHDGDGNALCPQPQASPITSAPEGTSSHAHYSVFERIHLRRPSSQEVFNESEFLTDFRKVAAESTRGCIILERPDLLKDLAERHGAKDTTIRGEASTRIGRYGNPSFYNTIQERKYLKRSGISLSQKILV